MRKLIWFGPHWSCIWALLNNCEKRPYGIWDHLRPICTVWSGFTHIANRMHYIRSSVNSALPKQTKKKVHYIKYADRWKSNSLRFSHWWLRLTQYTTSRKYWPTYFTFVERDLVYYVVTYTRTTVRYSFEVFWSAYASCGKVERTTYIYWQWIFPMRTG